MNDQEVFLIKTFYSSGGFCVALDRQYRREFPSLLYREETSSGEEVCV